MCNTNCRFFHSPLSGYGVKAGAQMHQNRVPRLLTFVTIQRQRNPSLIWRAASYPVTFLRRAGLNWTQRWLDMWKLPLRQDLKSLRANQIRVTLPLIQENAWRRQTELCLHCILEIRIALCIRYGYDVPSERQITITHIA